MIDLKVAAWMQLVLDVAQAIILGRGMRIKKVLLVNV
jgi:hypothetical protein